MKTSFISNLSIQNAMRLTIQQTQTELVKSQKEAVTSKHYDMGLALAEKTSQSLDINREVSRLKSIQATNSLVTSRLSASQVSLTKIADAGQSILKTILAFGGNEDETSINTSKTSIKNDFAIYTDMANMAQNGEFLFSGINTDVQPLEDFQKAGSPAKAAFDLELSYFLGQQAPPLTDKAQMSPTQMQAFLDDIEKKFNGATPLTDPPHTGNGGEDFWKTYVSKATDENMTSRISKTEVVETSSNANSQGMRYMALGTVVALEFMDVTIKPEVRLTVKAAAQQFVYKGMTEITAQQGRLGLSEERVTKADDAIEAQTTILSTYLFDLEGVDSFEASTRLKNLLALVDASYTLTARIQQLSLVNFL